MGGLIRYLRPDDLVGDPPPDAERCSVIDDYGRRCRLVVHHFELQCLASIIPPAKAPNPYGKQRHANRKGPR